MDDRSMLVMSCRRDPRRLIEPYVRLVLHEFAIALY